MLNTIRGVHFPKSFEAHYVGRLQPRKSARREGLLHISPLKPRSQFWLSLLGCHSRARRLGAPVRSQNDLGS